MSLFVATRKLKVLHAVHVAFLSDSSVTLNLATLSVHNVCQMSKTFYKWVSLDCDLEWVPGEIQGTLLCEASSCSPVVPL